MGGGWRVVGAARGLCCRLQGTDLLLPLCAIVRGLAPAASTRAFDACNPVAITIIPPTCILDSGSWLLLVGSRDLKAAATRASSFGPAAAAPVPPPYRAAL